MKATLKILGATLNQVVHQVGDGASAPARALALSLVLAASGPVHAGVSGYGAGAEEADAEMAAQDAADGRHEGNTAARVLGGLAGAGVGAAITRKSSDWVRALGVLTGAYAGQAAGDVLTRDTVVVGPDGKPIKKNAAALKNGPEAYRNAVFTTFSAQGVGARREQGDNAVGSHSKPLPSDLHKNLADLMVEAAASRVIASRLLENLDTAELYNASAPNDQRRAAAVNAAGESYQTAFYTYATNHRNAWNVIDMASGRGFDVSAQRMVMGVMPADLRSKLGQSIDWPGVRQKVAQGSGSPISMTNYSQLTQSAGASRESQGSMQYVRER